MKKILSLFFALVAISFSAFSQGAPASGTVINSNGNVVVTITYVDSLAGTSGTLTVTTDANGAFQVLIPFTQNPTGQISLFAWACITTCTGQTTCDMETWTPGTIIVFNPLFYCGNVFDMDGDGYSTPVDCNDSDAMTYPGANEVCNNGVDNNCNGTIDEGCNGDSTFVDTDGDGYPAFADCNDNNPWVNPGAIEECNNGVDNNCDGNIDEGCNGDTTAVDNDNDGYTSLVDCNDSNPWVNPGAFEECNNGIDNDCDGIIDEDCGGLDCSANIILLTDSALNGAGNAYEVWVINATNPSGNTFVWNMGDGMTLTGAYPTYTYSELGTYTLCVYVTNAAGCVDSACVTFTVNPDGSVSPGGALQQTFTLNVSAAGPVGVDEMNISNELNVYPNPAQDQTTITWNADRKENGTTYIYGINGQVVASFQYQGVTGRNQIQLNTSEWSTGLYQIVMISEKGVKRSVQVAR